MSEEVTFEPVSITIEQCLQSVVWQPIQETTFEELFSRPKLWCIYDKEKDSYVVTSAFTAEQILITNHPNFELIAYCDYPQPPVVKRENAVLE